MLFKSIVIASISFNAHIKANGFYALKDGSNLRSSHQQGMREIASPLRRSQ
jgi:hypothetical protein